MFVPTHRKTLCPNPSTISPTLISYARLLVGLCFPTMFGSKGTAQHLASVSCLRHLAARCAVVTSTRRGLDDGEDSPAPGLEITRVNGSSNLRYN